MSQPSGSGTSQGALTSRSATATASASGTAPEDDWSAVEDPDERRKIQNRIAQRKFRDKVRQKREEAERNAENQRRAGAAYTTPEPEDIDRGLEEDGLPWGSFSMRHVFETG